MRLSQWLALLAAAAVLTVAARRAVSLRPAARALVVAIAVDLALLPHVTRGGLAYRGQQLAALAWLAAVALVAGVPPRVAGYLGAIGLGALLAWYPLPAAPVYAGLQGLTVAVGAVYLSRTLRARRAPLAGHYAGGILLLGEACALGPYLVGGPLAASWVLALPVRLAQWLALCVLGYRSWCSGYYSPSRASRSASPARHTSPNAPTDER
jgi:hypothetical protein